MCRRAGAVPQPTSELDICARYAGLVQVVRVLELERPEQRVAGGVVTAVGDVDAAHERRQLPCAGAVLPALLHCHVQQHLQAEFPKLSLTVRGCSRLADCVNEQQCRFRMLAGAANEAAAG